MDFIWDFVDPGLFVSQVINFLILFFLIKHFLGDHLTNMIAERRALMSKVDNAEADYQAVMDKAHAEKQGIIDEALAHKANVVAEAEAVATKKADAILADAEKASQQMKHEAKEHASKLENQLKDSYVDGVKHTARLVVKKLFAKDKDLNEAYLDELTSEFTTSAK